MNFNWCYYPLETDGKVAGIQNTLPDFSTQYGNPWLANNGWFNGNGIDTSIITPWESAPALFEGVALPNDGAFLIGFQIKVGALPASHQTILSCGYNAGGNVDGIRIEYRTNGRIRFTFENRNFTDLIRETDDISNSLKNIFCYIDHRPAGIGVNSANVHTYTDGTDVKTSPRGVDLSTLGNIYPEQINSAVALIIGALQSNGQPRTGSHFNGKIRRIHMMKFGSMADDTPGNIAEIMNELSLNNMVPTNEIILIAGLPEETIKQDFVRYV